MQEHIEMLEAARSRVYREWWEANGAAVPKLKADAEEIDRHFQAACELAIKLEELSRENSELSKSGD